MTIEEAQKMIDAVENRWVSLGRAPDTLYTYDNHVKGVAQIAQTLALRLGNVDAKQSYVSGLLHDIAKIDESPESMIGRFHGILGYELLKDKDPTAARACLLHEFPWNKIPPFENVSKKLFGNKNDYDFIKDFAAKNPLKDDDLIIQLSDVMANKNGIVTIEKRLQEYEERFKTKIPKEFIEPYMEIKEYLSQKIGQDIYEMLGVV